MTRAREISNVLGRNIESTTFTATAGQTAFSIAHTENRIQVFMNGLLLDQTVDWTSDGSTVTLTSGATAGDEIEVVKYDNLSVANVVPSTGGTFSGDVTVDGSITLNNDVATNGYDVNKITLYNASSYHYGFGVSSEQLNYRAGGSTDQHVFYAGTTERMRIDGAGRVTTPYNPYFKATSVPGSNSNGSTIVYSTAHNNNGNCYSTSTGRFTAPVGGLYFFGCSLRAETANSTFSYFRTVFQLNGSNINSTAAMLFHHHNGNYSSASNHHIVEMNAGDYVNVRLESAVSSVTTGSPSENVFYGYLIG